MAEMSKAVTCLALELPESVHNDVSKIWTKLKTEIESRYLSGKIEIKDYAAGAPGTYSIQRPAKEDPNYLEYYNNGRWVSYGCEVFYDLKHTQELVDNLKKLYYIENETEAEINNECDIYGASCLLYDKNWKCLSTDYCKHKKRG